jgi:metal-sulfur cluster biosynthetic enzyme
LTHIKARLIFVNLPSTFRATVLSMGHAMPTLWMQAAQPSSSCAGCVTSDAGPRCRAQVTGEDCLNPELAGRSEQLARVLDVLNREVIDPDAGRGIVDLHWVKALRIQDGEAELTLSFAPACGPGKQLSETAFQTLRRLLPDTDVYVRHDA